MKSDFEIIQHHFDDEIILYPISDIHLGAAEHMARAWNKFCLDIQKQKNAYIILGGDLINNGTRSSVGNIFEETMRPRDQKKEMVSMLAPLRNKILCAVPGNHERRSIKDADDEPMYDIMCKLDLEDLYRPNTAIVKIGLGKRSNADKPESTYMGAITHGAGGGIFTGATVNRNERFSYTLEGLDFLCVGHTHKGAITRPERMIIDPRNNNIIRRDCVVVSMESWQAYGGYAMQKMLLPSNTGRPQKLRLYKDRYNKKVETIW